MTGDRETAAARELIDRHLATMDHVQVLLHLRRTPEGADAKAMSAALNLDEKTVAKVIADLSAAGIVSTDGSGRFISAPTEEATRNAVEALEILYNTRPVTLVRMIYDRPPAALRSFADAFRIRPPGT